MKKNILLLFINLLFSYYSFAIDNLKPLIGLVKISPVGCFIIDADKTCVEHSKIEGNLKKKNGNIISSLFSYKSYDSQFYFAFEKHNSLYRIAALWDNENNEFVDLYNTYSKLKPIRGYQIYNKSLFNKRYTIKYIWYSYKKNPLVINDPVAEYISIQSYFNNESKIRFRLLYDRNYNLLDKPNGKALFKITSKDMKSFQMKSKQFSHINFKGHAFFLKGLDYKVVNKNVWVKIKIPHKRKYSEEIEFDKIVDFEVIQSSYGKDIVGWIKAFDEQNMMNFN